MSVIKDNDIFLRPKTLKKIENEYPKNVHIDEQETKGNN